MQTMNPYVKQYQKNQIETATPEQVLILLYDGAILYLNKAKVALEQKNGEQWNKNLLGCEKIILEFMDTLDMESGGELAKNLYRLYEYFYNTLVNANLNKNIQQVEEISKHLKGLRETWQKAIAIANAEKKADLLDNPESLDGSEEINDSI